MITKDTTKEIALENIRDFEKEFLAFMDERYPEVGKDIVAKGSITPENEEDLKEAILEFKKEAKNEYILDSQQVMSPQIPVHEPEAAAAEEQTEEKAE